MRSVPTHNFTSSSHKWGFIYGQSLGWIIHDRYSFNDVFLHLSEPENRKGTNFWVAHKNHCRNFIWTPKQWCQYFERSNATDNERSGQRHSVRTNMRLFILRDSFWHFGIPASPIIPFRHSNGNVQAAAAINLARTETKSTPAEFQKACSKRSLSRAARNALAPSQGKRSRSPRMLLRKWVTSMEGCCHRRPPQQRYGWQRESCWKYWKWKEGNLVHDESWGYGSRDISGRKIPSQLGKPSSPTAIVSASVGEIRQEVMQILETLNPTLREHILREVALADEYSHTTATQIRELLSTAPFESVSQIWCWSKLRKSVVTL